MPGGPRSQLDQLKTAAQARSYLYCWSRSHIIQDVCTDVDHLQQVGEELLHHGHQGPVTQSWPHLFLLGGCRAGLFFGGPRTPQRSGGTGCDKGTHVTSPAPQHGAKTLSPSDPSTSRVCWTPPPGGPLMPQVPQETDISPWICVPNLHEGRHHISTQDVTVPLLIFTTEVQLVIPMCWLCPLHSLLMGLFPHNPQPLSCSDSLDLALSTGFPNFSSNPHSRQPSDLPKILPRLLVPPRANRLSPR